jgi:hypothetical protein
VIQIHRDKAKEGGLFSSFYDELTAIYYLIGFDFTTANVKEEFSFEELDMPLGLIIEKGSLSRGLEKLLKLNSDLSPKGSGTGLALGFAFS